MKAAKLQTAIRQEQIAQAALDLAASHGLKGLSVARVAQQVGLVPSAIYRHFQGKDEVLNAILGLIQDRLLHNVQAVRAETADPLDQLRRLLLRHVRLIGEHQAIPRLIFSEEVYSGHPERKAKVYGIISGYLQRVGDIVRQGQRQGRIRSDVAPNTLAVMFLGLVQPAAILWHMSDGGFDVTKHVEQAWRVFREAIRAKGS
jgi:AcrR family transcriptional regulator